MALTNSFQVIPTAAAVLEKVRSAARGLCEHSGTSSWSFSSAEHVENIWKNDVPRKGKCTRKSSSTDTFDHAPKVPLLGA
eukprot:8447348-Alexandrium_andersonii.AAC.1